VALSGSHSAHSAVAAGCSGRHTFSRRSGLDAVLQKMWPQRAVLAATAVWCSASPGRATFYFAVYPTLPNLYLEYMGDRVDVGRFIDASDWNGRQLTSASPTQER